VTAQDWLADYQWTWWPGVLERSDGSSHDVLVACHRTIPSASLAKGIRDPDGTVFYLGPGDRVKVTYQPDVT
jgi:hypothetical protein